MSISITRDEVKQKAMIAASDTTHDTAISALITQMQAPLEYSIAGRFLADTGDTGLQATLKLGMLEIITGEFLEQLRRETGATEEFSAAGVSVGASSLRGSDLVQQGATRLAPYLKASPPAMDDTTATSTTVDTEPVFSKDEGVW